MSTHTVTLPQGPWNICVAEFKGSDEFTDGEYCTVAFYLVAGSKDGYDFAHNHVFAAEDLGYVEAKAQADALCAKVQARVDANPNWQPNEAYWTFERVAYGTPAYEAEREGEAQFAAEMWEAELEAWGQAGCHAANYVD